MKERVGGLAKHEKGLTKEVESELGQEGIRCHQANKGVRSLQFQHVARGREKEIIKHVLGTAKEQFGQNKYPEGDQKAKHLENYLKARNLRVLNTQQGILTFLQIQPVIWGWGGEFLNKSDSMKVQRDHLGGYQNRPGKWKLGPGQRKTHETGLRLLMKERDIGKIITSKES